MQPDTWERKAQVLLNELFEQRIVQSEIVEAQQLGKEGDGVTA